MIDRRPPFTNEGPTRSTAGLIGLGMRGRCPRCGVGRLFDGFLDISDRCGVCGPGFGGHDAGDGPAVFGIFVIGAVVVGLALLLELALAPPTWVHLVLWTPLILFGSVAILRPLKGVTLALQYKFRSLEEPGQPGGA